ncbi:MAG: hypothetical protein GX131_17040 [candidate division WS1 bacterium]|jgi:hypothetical protein|nr:hypothetical protein [candidate division WS1 bacterium]
MKMSNRRMLMLVAVMFVLIAGTVTSAMAQPAPQEGQQAEEGGRRGGDRAAAFRGMMPTSPAIAVADGAVFLFVRNTLYKFDANTLELLTQCELPTPERPAREQ